MKNFLKLLRISLVSCFALAYALTAYGSDNDRNPSRQYVYAISNSPSGNSVVGYQFGANGSLIPLAGSPFSTHGLGQGVSLLVSSDNGLVVSADNRFMFVPNRGSNDISVFHIRPNGSLVSVPGSPFRTGGITPTSLALHGNTLFVAHTGLDLFNSCRDCDYRGFRVSKSGRLTPIEGATIQLSVNPASEPFAIRFSPDGRYLIGTETGTNKINIYKVTQNARPGQATLEPVPGSPFDSVGKLPLGFNFNPQNPTQMFVSNVGVAPGPGSVSSFLMATSGQIALIAQPVSTGQLATCWINVTEDGKWLFASNTDSDSISAYSVSRDGRLALVDTTPLPRNGVPSGTLLAPVDMVIMNDEYLYALTRDVPAITSFKIAPEGKLIPIAETKFNIPNAVPFGLTSVNLRKTSFQPFIYEDD